MTNYDHFASRDEKSKTYYIGKEYGVYKKYDTYFCWQNAMSKAHWDDMQCFHRFIETFENVEDVKERTTEEVVEMLMGSLRRKAAVKFISHFYNVTEEDTLFLYKDKVTAAMKLLEGNKECENIVDLIDEIPTTGQRHALLIVSGTKQVKELLTYVQDLGYCVQLRNQNIILPTGMLAVRNLNDIGCWYAGLYSDVIMPNDLESVMKTKILARWRSTYVEDGQLFMY